MINSLVRAKDMQKIISYLALSLSLLLPVASFAETKTGPIAILNYAQKTFSIEGVEYQIVDGVQIKELYNEHIVWLFAQLEDGLYLQIEFSKSSTQPKKVTKAYFEPQ